MSRVAIGLVGIMQGITSVVGVMMILGNQKQIFDVKHMIEDDQRRKIYRLEGEVMRLDSRCVILEQKLGFDSYDEHERSFVCFCYAKQLVAAAMPTVQSLSASKIPKIIHQTYEWLPKSGVFKQSMDAWTKMHPKYKYRFADRGQMNRDVKKFCRIVRMNDKNNERAKKIEEGFQSDKTTNVERADIWRYMAVYLYGGIYADMDTMPSMHADDWQLPLNCRLVLGWHKPHEEMCQWTFAAQPRQKEMYDCAIRGGLQAYNEPELPTMDKTGPNLFTDELAKLAEKDDTIALFDAKRFGMHGWKAVQDIRSRSGKQELKASGSYVVHLGTATWRPWYRKWYTHLIIIPIAVLVLLLALVIGLVIRWSSVNEEPRRPISSSPPP